VLKKAVLREERLQLMEEEASLLADQCRRIAKQLLNSLGKREEAEPNYPRVLKLVERRRLRRVGTDDEEPLISEGAVEMVQMGL